MGPYNVLQTNCSVCVALGGVGALVDYVYGKDRDKLFKLYKTQEKSVNKEIDKVYNIRVQNVMMPTFV